MKKKAKTEIEPPPFTRADIRRLVADFASQSVDKIYESVGGSPDKCILLCRIEAATNEAVKPLIEMWDTAKIPQKRKLTIDKLCDDCNFPRDEMVALLAKYTYKASREVSELFFVAYEPHIVAEALEDALNRKDAIGHDMRKEIMRARGLLPTAKSQIIVNATATAQSIAAQSAEAFGLPSFEESIKDSAHLLPESDAEPLDTDAEFAPVEIANGS